MPLGIMLYGYEKGEADRIIGGLSELTGEEVIGASAAGREKELVSAIIGDPAWETFGDRKTKVLMFLGFDDNQIGKAMKSFPGDLERPIFCALTEQNVNWMFDYLVEHLREERERFRQMDKKQVA